MSNLKNSRMIDHFDDGTLRVSWGVFGDALAWRLNFCTAHPSFWQTLNMKDRLMTDLGIYLGCIEVGNPLYVYNDETKGLWDEVKESYERFVASYPDSAAMPLVSGALAEWEKNGYKYNDAMDAYLEIVNYKGILE